MTQVAPSPGKHARFFFLIVRPSSPSLVSFRVQIRIVVGEETKTNITYAAFRCGNHRGSQRDCVRVRTCPRALNACVCVDTFKAHYSQLPVAVLV